MLHQSWIEGFDKTCQALLEDTLLLEALAAHICKQEMFSVSARAFKRLSDYLTQHAGDPRQLGASLRSLQKTASPGERGRRLITSAPGGTGGRCIFSISGRSRRGRGHCGRF